MENREFVKDLTLMLLYLTSWDEKVGTSGKVTRSWRSYDWDALDALRDDGLVSGNRKAKSVYLTNEGIAEAVQLLARFETQPEKPTVTDKPKKIRKTAGAGPSAFKFRIELDFYELRCWREIIVPAGYSFLDFHIVIQDAFNWLGYHLYDFVLTHHGSKVEITTPTPGAIDSIWAGVFGGLRYVEPLEELDAAEILLGDVFPRSRTAVYSYDYGDGWEHKIKMVEKLDDYTSDEPLCTDGEGDAPPDDVGAEGGFIEFLRIIADKSDPEHDEMVEWGEEQQFERFSLAAVNEKLAFWREHKSLHEAMHGI